MTDEETAMSTASAPTASGHLHTTNAALGRAAAVLAWLVGLGFGLPCVFGIRYFAQHGIPWTFMGFPTYGEGPFEDAGVPTSLPLLVAFLVVCVAELVMGWLLWRRRRSGMVLAVGLLPFEFAFWYGFLLPFGFWFGAARTVLVVLLVVLARRQSSARRRASELHRREQVS